MADAKTQKTTSAAEQKTMPAPTKGYGLADHLTRITPLAQAIQANQQEGKWDKDLTLDQAFARLEQQDTLIMAALDLLVQCEQDTEQKDIAPASDLLGRAKLTASAVKYGFKRKMKEYTESTIRHTVADSIYDEISTMRETIKRMRTHAEAIREKIANARDALEAQRKLYEQSAAPKLAAKKSKKQKQLEKLQAELAELDRQSA